MINKKSYYLLLVLLFVCVMPYKIAAADTLQPMDEFYVNDFADVINDDVEGEIIEYGNQLEEQTGAQVVLVTIDFTDGESLENYAMNLFNEWGIGSKEKNNGLLLLLSIGDDDYWAMQGEGLEDTLSSGKISSILQEYLEPDFAAKDYSAGVEKTYGAFIQELGGQWKNASNDSGKNSRKTTGEYAFDDAGIISNDAKNYINEKSTETKELYDAGFYVVTKDYCEDGLSFQDDAINTFEDLNAGRRDALLVLYKEEDNYWLLPGEESEEFTTEKVLRDILDNVLEPEFASKDYSQGAIDTADRFYDLFQTNLKKLDENYSVKSVNISEKADNLFEKINIIGPFITFILFLLFVLFIISRSRRRRYYRNNYGVPYNPNSPRYNRNYGPSGYWGPYGQPPMGGNNFNAGMNTQPNNNDDNGAGRSTSRSGFWGSSGGAGRSSSESNFVGSSSREEQAPSRGNFSGGGGISRGGGAGRSSGGIGRSGVSGHASGGGRSSSGGGGNSRGGGTGRK